MFNIGSNENENINLELDIKGVNNLRGIALDMIVEANSGHGGIIMSSAPIIYTIFKYHMNIDINDLNFINRDKFILSAGHGAPLLYGIDYFLNLLELDDLKSLRKLNSKTPGHPELETPLVDFSSGALGTGIGASVGYAIGERYLNSKTNGLIEYYTYVLCGDGELEEGITYESLSLAGTLNLNKLIVLVDLNEVTLDSKLNITSNEDLVKRFQSINFNVIETTDSVNDINESITEAKKSNKPSIIFVKTKIGLYSKYEDTNKAHGMVPNLDELLNIKEKLGLFESHFIVNQDVIEDFKNTITTRSLEKINNFKEKYNQLEDKTFINKIINKEITYNFSNTDIEYNEESLKDLSGKILNKIADNFDLLIGGSCDLSSVCKTNLDNFDIFNESNYGGRNIYFGIREQASSAIINGIALSGLRPFVSTFLVFSDLMRINIRLSAFMNLPVLYIFTHDSITVGEDGAIHQAVEQLASLELIPNLKVYRPYDLNELIGCIKDIFKNTIPSVLILPRNNNNISNNTKTNGVETGIYEVIKPATDNYINLISNGEELGIVLETSKNLKEFGIDNRVFSIPCKKNIKSDIEELLNNKETFAITLTTKEYFYDITKNVIGINSFGKSAKKEDLLDYFGIESEKLTKKILEYLKK